jgi:hypothetical protein
MEPRCCGAFLLGWVGSDTALYGDPGVDREYALVGNDDQSERVKYMV